MMKNFLPEMTIVITILLTSLMSNTSFAENQFIKVTKKNPTIIALAPHIVEMLYEVGAGKQIIGTTAFADYPEQAKEIPRIGNYVRLQLERVIELQPDLIIAWKSGNPSDDLARLKQLGFTIVYSQPNSFSDIAKEFRHFANISGHSQQGEKVALQFEQDLEKIMLRYQDKEKISGFYELWSRPLTTVAKGSWPQQFLKVCQVHNPFEQAATPYPQVNIVQLLQKEVSLIIQPLSVNQKEREGFNWQDWPIIPAVKNSHIIQPDADALHRMTGRSLIALKDLCQAVDKTRIKLSTSTNGTK
jgi:vitamin B12 transport system substrate-binding protein